MQISVIIPTYNRKETLNKCLSTIMDQTISSREYEIIIIDDGSNDGTDKFMEKIKVSSQNQIKYIKHDLNKGHASALNSGIKIAIGELIIFIDDDIFTPPNFLEEHYKSHIGLPQANIAILGLIEWHPELNTPFMKWLKSKYSGYFDLWKYHDGQQLDYKHFWTGNLSIKRGILDENDLFDEDFDSLKGLDDIEFGYRLQKKGMKLFFNKKARSYHYQLVTPEKYIARAELMGRATKLLYKKHPELNIKHKINIKQRLALSLKKLIYPLAKRFNLSIFIFTYTKIDCFISFLKGFNS